MMVWLHTSSPPQHIASITETDFAADGGAKAYLVEINRRRGLRCAFAGVFEAEHGETSVHIFDNGARADAWIERNQQRESLLVGSDD